MKSRMGFLLVLIAFSAQSQVVVKNMKAYADSLKSTQFYIIDGIRIGRQKQMPKIDPGDIEEVNIIKKEDAQALFGSKGVNEVIIITTTSGTFGKVKATLLSNDAPLWVIDGVEIMNEGDPIQKKIDKIDPNDIKSMEVLKADSALLAYGDWGRNGVIIVTTKKGHYKKSE